MKMNYMKIAYFISIVVADFVGLGISVTVFPNFLLKGGGAETIMGASPLILMGLPLGIYPLGQFFGAAILGKPSDHHGRKPLLVFFLLGTIAGLIMTAVSLGTFNIPILLAGRLISGVFAGNVSMKKVSGSFLMLGALMIHES